MIPLCLEDTLCMISNFLFVEDCSMTQCMVYPGILHRHLTGSQVPYTVLFVSPTLNIMNTNINIFYQNLCLFYFSVFGGFMVEKELIKNPGTSLVAQWLRSLLPVRGTRVRALVWEDPTCLRATKPVHCNYWACALEPASHNYWSPRT